MNDDLQIKEMRGLAVLCIVLCICLGGIMPLILPLFRHDLNRYNTLAWRYATEMNQDRYCFTYCPWLPNEGAAEAINILLFFDEYPNAWRYGMMAGGLTYYGTCFVGLMSWCLKRLVYTIPLGL